MQTDIHYYKTITTPVGNLRLIASDKGLSAILFNGGRKHGLQQWQGPLERSDNHPILKKTEKQLAEYFKGGRTEFELPLDVRGTVFQVQAWRVLKQIPYGKTISYGDQARKLGDAGKARAVGMANGRNPICIVVPCHRVIGTSGELVGFGGGLKIKKYLLDHEKKNLTAKSA